MKRWTIEVTQEDIEAGERRTYSFCPVALSVKRAVGRECTVAVSQVAVLVRFPNENSYFWLPSQRLARWITRFDLEQGVQPGRFALTIPRAARGGLTGARTPVRGGYDHLGG